MARIVIAGRSAQSREQMASLLSSSGYPVYRLCSSAGELRRVLNDCDDGLLILAGQLPDCSADELFWDYGSQVQILLIPRRLPPGPAHLSAGSARRSGNADPAAPHASAQALRR